MASENKVKAVIFDLDGTLVDTAPDLAGSLNYCLAEEGHAPFPVEDMRHLVGHGAGALINRGLEIREGETPAPERLHALRQRFLAHYQDHVADHSVPFDGVEALLEKLTGQNIPIGICTNKPEGLANSLVQALGWTDLFTEIVGGDRWAFKKPDARHLLGTAESLGHSAMDCIFFGDSEVDFHAAQNAQMRIILVEFGYSVGDVRELGAHAVLSHYDEALAAMAGLTPKLHHAAAAKPS